MLDKFGQLFDALLEHEHLDLVLLILWKSNSPVLVQFPLNLLIHGLSDVLSSMSRVQISTL